MLIRELIAGHVGVGGALHERGIRLGQAHVPPGLTIHHEGDENAAGDDHGGEGRGGEERRGDGRGGGVVQGGDLLVIAAPLGTGLREHIDTDLPVGATVLLLFEVEVSELPVGRVLAALGVASLQVVEATVVSGVSAATVAVVARRTDDLVVPSPYLAHDLEPGNHEGPAVLRRVLGEHALEGLVQPARERALLEQVAEIGVRLGQVTVERERLQAERQDHAAMVRDRDAARMEADSERKRMLSLVKDMDALREKVDIARKDAEAQRKRMRDLRTSRSFKLASRLARVADPVRRLVPKP